MFVSVRMNSNLQTTQNENSILDNQIELNCENILPQLTDFDYEYGKAHPFEYLKNAKTAKEIRNLTIKEIVKICLHNKMSNDMTAILLLIVRNETGDKFNPIHIMKNKGVRGESGIFQLWNNNHTKTHSKCNNICSGKDRHNIYKAIPAVVKKLEYSRKIIENKLGVWDDAWYYTRIHNSGLANAKSNPLVLRTQREIKNNRWGKIVDDVIEELLFEQNLKEFQKIKNIKENYFVTIDKTKVTNHFYKLHF